MVGALAKRAIPVTESPAAAGWFRLKGTRGRGAAVGAVSEDRDGNVCWTLHPAYAAWLWPLMLKATALALLVPKSVLEPAEDEDVRTAPRPPTEAEKDVILKSHETEADAVRVYTLALHGKPQSIRKAFPTRTVSLATLRYCSKRIRSRR